MKYDKYAACRPPRRVLLRGALGLGLLGAVQLLNAPEAQTPRSGAFSSSDDAKPGAPPGYRLHPAAGTRAFPGGRQARPVALRRTPHRMLREGGRKIALTFDDGPHPTQTPAVLRILRRYGTRATFFVIGENAAHDPDLLRAIAHDGHLVGNHSYSHPQLDLIPTRRVRTELGRTSDLIDRVLGRPPRLARAPYGMWHAPSLRVCAELQMEPFQWSIDTRDWEKPGAEYIEAAVLSGAEPGAIVLAHDGGGDRWQTVRALEYYLPRLLDRGYTMSQPQ